MLNTNLAGGRVVVTLGSGKIINSGITTTELNFLDNCTANIQTQINSLQSASNVASLDLTALDSTVSSGFKQIYKNRGR